MKKNKISLRVTEELDNFIIKQSRICNLSKTDYIIKCLTDNNVTIIDRSAELVSGLCRLSSAFNKLTLEYPEANLEPIEMECNKIWRILK